MSRIRCPNCGGNKVRSGELNIGCSFLHLFGKVIVFGAVIAIGLGWLINSATTDWGMPNFLLWGGIVILILGVLFLIAYRIYAQAHYKCLVCGNRWQTSYLAHLF